MGCSGRGRASAECSIALRIVLFRVAFPIAQVGYHIISDMTDEDYMRMAIEEARRAEELDEVPIGAVVVYEPIDPGTRRP